MKIEQTKKLKDAEFRRLIGVKRETFTKMLEILEDAEKKKRKRGGRKNKLCLEDRLIASLSYWREYRTYAHIAADFGIDESNIIRSVKWIEDVLIKDGTFSLPGKKALIGDEVEYEVILIDATESPIERPKKGGKENIIRARKNTTR
jgi:transcription initiation factor TFIIIB Brf1 subunit/transcription initiation factor TFIIB